MNIPLNKTLWLKEGFILQSSYQEYWLGQGPFSYGKIPYPRSVYHPDFFLKFQKPWLYPSLTCKINKLDLTRFLFTTKKSQNRDSKFEDSFSLTSPYQLKHFFKPYKKPSFISYQETFFQAKQAINQKIFKKVVPVCYESFNKRLNVLLLIQNLFKNTQNSTNGFLYGVWNNTSGIMGFTPEILFSFQGRQFSTMALAGTCSGLGPSLLKNKKEMQEHYFVLQSIKDALKGLIQWETQSPAFEILFPSFFYTQRGIPIIKSTPKPLYFPLTNKYPRYLSTQSSANKITPITLKHLQTNLRGRFFKQLNFERICRKLHPTAAVGGYPKKPAFHWLKNHPLQKNRIYFGAPLGFFESELSTFCLVALRALEWNQKTSWIFSGGGLLKESLLQKEWQELSLKREQIKAWFLRNNSD